MAIKLTKDQENAVMAKGAVVVTAAAGSGKTAVLVEKVIKMLCDLNNPVSADRLLIVTFTNAAAAEMKQRIEKRLTEECEKYPENTHILKQQLLISSADICTIDSFCIKLVRNNFSRLGISPDFKIIDEIQAKKIMQQVLGKIFNRDMEEKRPEFFKFLYSTNAVYGDENAANYIFKIYNDILVLPFYERWLDKCIESYNPKNFLNSVWGNFAFSYTISNLEYFIKALKKLLLLLSNDLALLLKLEDAVKNNISHFEKALGFANEKNWNSLRECIINTPGFPGFKNSVKKSGETTYDKITFAQSKQIISSINSKISRLGNVFEFSFEQIEEQMQENGEIACEMLRLVKEFDDNFFAELTKKGYLTFALTEQLAFKLLCDYKDGKAVASAISDELSQMYDAVMVDEYQDVNELQNTLFSFLSDGGKKLFTVGDAKQSIYGFRGSKPENFIERSEKAVIYNDTLKSEEIKRIVLSKNFRSRKGICNFINGFFTLLMTKDFGGISYDQYERLYPEADFPENFQLDVELHIIPDAKRELQANNVADYIISTAEKEPFLKGENGELRKAEYGDFAILMRTGTPFETYFEQLSAKGIPVCLSNGDFFETTEIKIMMAFLSAVHSPMNDAALLAVLMSPLFGFTAEDVANLKANNRDKRLFTLILEDARNSDSKFKQFLKVFSSLRQKAACLPTADFVSYLYEETDFINAVQALSDGNRRVNNLIYLTEIAAGFSSDFMGDLGAFIGHLSYLKQEGKTLSKTQVLDNSVVISTMHKSKGLQYPITIICETNSAFSSKDVSSTLTVNDTLGIAFDKIDDELSVKQRPITKRIMNLYISTKQKEEELRLLYVAMTRAEEKLAIFVGNKENKAVKSAAATLVGSMGDDGVLNAQSLMECSNFCDWIMLYALLFSPFAEVREEYGVISENILPFLKELGDTAEIIFHNEACDEEKKPEEENKESEIIIDDEFLYEIEDRFSYNYPWEELRKIEAKTSVSQLAKKKADREFCATARPAFLAESGLTPTQRGTALHKFMQYCNFEKAHKNVEAEIERLFENEYISLEESEVIDPKQIKAFMNTELFGRILSASQLFREQRFLLEEEAAKLYPDLSDKVQDKTVIIQGAIDCMFIENEKIILIDFKTDRTNSEASLLSHYAEQLRIYSVAATKMFELPVTECYIYSLYMNKWIPVKL